MDDLKRSFCLNGHSRLTSGTSMLSSVCRGNYQHPPEIAVGPAPLDRILVTTLAEVVEDDLRVVGDARRNADLLVAEADGCGPQRS